MVLLAVAVGTPPSQASPLWTEPATTLLLQALEQPSGLALLSPLTHPVPSLRLPDWVCPCLTAVEVAVGVGPGKRGWV